jgi:suppressor of G2 allele of SKP1
MFAEALEDADKALKLDGGSHMASYWKGIALFYFGDFDAAKQSFEASLRACPEAKAARSLWIRKCDAELSGSALPLGGVVAEASKVPSAASSAKPAAPAPPAPVAEPARQAEKATPPAAVKEALTTLGRKPVKREWYQNNTHVMITIFQKGMERDRVRLEFHDRSLSLNMQLPGDGDDSYSLELDLFDAIVPDKCTVEVSKVKVEISLVKKSVGVQWKDLEYTQVLQEEAAAYPSSSKVKKDWSQIDRDIDSELKSEKPQGDEALNKLFKEIYEKADDETRRAMNKSFQTSGGTVLSTNWGEVGKADYEGKDRPTPPEGQEWKDWRDKTGDEHVPEHAK